MITPMKKRLPLILLLTILLSACQPTAATPTVDQGAIMTQAVATAMAQYATPTSTLTPVPTATAVRTPPALPGVFTTTMLNPKDTPHTYIADSCQYLKSKWDSNNSAPGTVVMVIMFHGVEKGTDVAADPMNIGGGEFKKLMNSLHDAGFQAIYTQQLADFLNYNAKIPQRSVLLIKDDRHSAEDFNDWFRPYWQEWHWPVVNAWISANDGIRALRLQENVSLSAEGWVDYQSHGTVHNINMTDASTDEYIRSEFEGSIKDLQENFKKTPIAIIWPGGGFGLRPVQIARSYGYQLGFTVNPRGPVMYNWVPLADASDPHRPSYMAEGYVNDPLMVLPRYWSADALTHIDTVMQIGEQAAAYAQQNKATELEYYDIVCAPTYGPVP